MYLVLCRTYRKNFKKLRSDSQTDRQTDRRVDRQTERRRGGETDGQTDGRAGTQKDRQTNQQMWKHKHEQLFWIVYKYLPRRILKSIVHYRNLLWYCELFPLWQIQALIYQTKTFPLGMPLEEISLHIPRYSEVRTTEASRCWWAPFSQWQHSFQMKVVLPLAKGVPASNRCCKWVLGLRPTWCCAVMFSTKDSTIIWIMWCRPGDRLNIKVSSYQYRDPRVKY